VFKPEHTHVMTGTPDQVFAEYTAHTAAALTAAALGSSCGKKRAASSANSSENWKCEQCPESGYGHPQPKK